MASAGVLRGLAPGGVVVAVDDEQWVDGDTRRLLEIAAARLSDAPMRWLVAVRSGHVGRGLVPVHEVGPQLTWVESAQHPTTARSGLEPVSEVAGAARPSVTRSADRDRPPLAHMMQERLIGIAAHPAPRDEPGSDHGAGSRMVIVEAEESGWPRALCRRDRHPGARRA